MTANRVVVMCLAIVALIHALPLMGLAGTAALERGYGVRLSDPNLTLLLVHRALMFGCFSAACIGAIIKPEWRGLVIGLMLVSTIGFALICGVMAFDGATINREITRVAIADGVAVIALLIARLAHHAAR
jgi:hypothetical protein